MYTYRNQQQKSHYTVRTKRCILQVQKALSDTLSFLRADFSIFSEAILARLYFRNRATRLFRIARELSNEYALRQFASSQSPLGRKRDRPGTPCMRANIVSSSSFFFFLLFVCHPLFLIPRRILSSRKLVPLPLFPRHFGGPSVATRRT